MGYRSKPQDYADILKGLFAEGEISKLEYEELKKKYESSCRSFLS
jgi:uncharacterized membrane protein